MTFLHAIVIAILAQSVSPAKFSLPLFKEQNESPRSFNPLSHRAGGSQKVLSHPTGHLYDSKHVVAAEGLPVTHYTINISLGTPPQPFRAIIDLNWAEPFVPSTTCGGPDCVKFAHYNSSASSTYRENGTITDLIYGPIFAYGCISSDTLTLSEDLEVPKLDFVELKYYLQTYPHDALQPFDSVLGLAIDTEWPPPTLIGKRPNELTGPFRHMIDEGLLDENVFSILWPRGKDDVGDLMFGGYNEELFEGELVKHSLFPKTTNEWQIGVEALYLKRHDGSVATQLLASESPPEWTAIMMSRTPSIGLPSIMAQLFLKELNTTLSECDGSMLIVDCDGISKLPELTIGLKGQNITLKGEDYIEKGKAPEYMCPDPPEECMVMVTALPVYHDFIPPDLMIFGTPFLRKVYGVFDWDEKSISFGALRE